MLLLPESTVQGTAALPPSPVCSPSSALGPAVQGQPGHCAVASVLRPLCCGDGEDSAEPDPGSSSAAAVHRPSSLHPAVPRYSPKRVLHRGLGPAVLRKAPSEAALWCHCRSLAHWHELFRALQGRGCGCCTGTKPPACRELPQHPCAHLYQTRWITRLSRGCSNRPWYQGTPGWLPIPTTHPDTSATTRRGGQPALGCHMPTCCFGAVQGTATTSKTNSLDKISDKFS